jgi:hypothetical protein
MTENESIFSPKEFKILREAKQKNYPRIPWLGKTKQLNEL